MCAQTPHEYKVEVFNLSSGPSYYKSDKTIPSSMCTFAGDIVLNCHVHYHWSPSGINSVLRAYRLIQLWVPQPESKVNVVRIIPELCMKNLKSEVCALYYM